MAAKVKSLKTIKTTHLTHVKRAMNSLRGHLEEDEPDLKQVGKYLRMVEEKYSRVVSDSEKIQEVLSDDEDITTEINSMDDLENQITELRYEAEYMLKEEANTSKQEVNDSLNTTLEKNTTLLNTLIEKLNEDKSKQENENLNATLQLIEKLQQNSDAKLRTSLLPTMTLPRFDGNIEKYTEFMDAYESVVHSHPEIDNVQKFWLLKTHLDEPASNTLEGFRTTNDDFEEALRLFKEAYGNKSLLRQLRVSKLLNLDKHDGKGTIRPLYNQVRTHIRSLENLEIDAEDYSLFLVPIVLSKLSTELTKRWYQKAAKQNNESIHHLLKWIKEEVEATESASYLEEAFYS